MNLRQALKPAQIVHYTGRVACGTDGKIIKAKVNGMVQVWKRDPDRVKVPVKRGLHEYTYITEGNLADWHLADDCPLLATPIDPEGDSQLDLVNEGEDVLISERTLRPW